MTKQSNRQSPDSSNIDSEQLLSGYASHAKGKSGIRRIINAGKFSIDGFKAAFANETAFRQLTFMNSFLVLVLIFCPFVLVMKMILIFASVFSMVVELFNTGLEAAIDHTSTDRHPLAKIAKDVGSAAQFLALGLLSVLWLMAIFSSL